MNITVYQCISIYNLKIGTISNSSVLQIGTSGRINTLSHNYETSGAPSSAPTTPAEKMASPRVSLPPAAELYAHLN
ncbi:spore germination protein GerPB [Paenibacillus sp. FSL H3-0310]|uniref:spore germination protein GerPB n=1 Tax=Paenibacillus sp. FSL H3-0310 TaxID=2921429 RepID=UPI0030FD088F